MTQMNLPLNVDGYSIYQRSISTMPACLTRLTLICCFRTSNCYYKWSLRWGFKTTKTFLITISRGYLFQRNLSNGTQRCSVKCTLFTRCFLTLKQLINVSSVNVIRFQVKLQQCRPLFLSLRQHCNLSGSQHYSLVIVCVNFESLQNQKNQRAFCFSSPFFFPIH